MAVTKQQDILEWCKINLHQRYAFTFTHLAGKNRTQEHLSSVAAYLRRKTVAPSLYIFINDFFKACSTKWKSSGEEKEGNILTTV